MLSSRVSIPSPPDPAQEDIFSSSLSSLFTDDTQNSHGTPGQLVIYHSPRHGEMRLGIPQHPDVEEGRKLFAHYLWNSGIVAADAIERASCDEVEDLTASIKGQVIWDRTYWDVTGKDVLELGAGTALPSLISARSGAKSITITDHPSSPALVTGTISQNVHENLKPPPQTHLNTTAKLPPIITIAGLTWGDPFFTYTTQYGKLTDPQPVRNSFHKIIIGDCLWMPSQHRNLVKTINLWLRDDSSIVSPLESGSPCALVIAGFHTGRATVASFFEIATGTDIAGDRNDMDHHGVGSGNDDTLAIAEIFEVDVNLNKREWVVERSGENKEQLKRWCVCAVLVRKDRSKHTCKISD